MVKHYLKIAWKNLTRNKLISFINISGLVIGISAFVLIMLYVNYENSYDKFFNNSERIYRVYMDYKEGNVYIPGDAQAYNLSGPTLKEEFPEIIDFVRFSHLDKTSFIYNNDVFEVLNGHLVDSSYFNVFDYSLINGDTRVALKEPNSIVLTERVAGKIFGKENPIGKVLTAYNDQEKTELTVTGIMKDIPENTHIKTNFLVSFQTNKNWKVCRDDLNWSNNEFFTYILLDKNADAKQLQQKIIQFDDGVQDERHNIEPITDIHLYSNKPYEAETNGSADRVKFLFAIAIAIIVISWLNYVNLSTTKSLERAKETGIRKTSGARKRQLVVQFLFESFLLNLLAVSLSFVLITIVLPFFNTYTEKQLIVGILNAKFYVLLTSAILVGTLFSGLYPAMVLSNFKPVISLKGKIRIQRNKFDVRKGLIILQFMATITLLIGTFTINKQIKYIQNRPLGFNVNQVVALNGEIFQQTSNLKNEYQVLKSELKKLPFVKSVSTSETYPGQGFYYISCFMGLTPPNTTKDDQQTVWYTYKTDEDYVSMMNLEILAGRSFVASDKDQNKIIINEKTAKKLGFDTPSSSVDQITKFWGEDWQITGVIKDYHHFGVKTEVEPVILRYDPVTTNNILLKLDNQILALMGTKKAIQQVEEIWKSVFKQSTFQYTFVDQQFEAAFREDLRFNKAFSIFTLLAIFISSMGLFGLALYISLQKTKEIGVRKVNGAGIGEILTMLNKEFVLWVITAFVIASPVAWFTMNKWLENFAYKTNLSWWIFALAGIIALLIALITVSWQSWRAANKNPVEALRYE